MKHADRANSHNRFPRFYNISAEELAQQSKLDTTTKPFLTSTSTTESLSTSLFIVPTSSEHDSISTQSTRSGEEATSVMSAPEGAITATSSQLHTQKQTGDGNTAPEERTSASTSNFPERTGQYLSRDSATRSPSSTGFVNSNSETSSTDSSTKSILAQISSTTALYTASAETASPVTAGDFLPSSQQNVHFKGALESVTSYSTPTYNPFESSSSSSDLSASATPTAGSTSGQQQPVLSSGDIGEISRSSLSTPSTTAKAPNRNYPSADNGNLAMAVGYNQIFKGLNEDSSCDPTDKKAFTACVDGQPASCEVDGHYSLQSCPQGQTCYAMPQPEGQSGIDIGCALPSVAAQRLTPNASPSSAMTLAAFSALPSSSVLGQSPTNFGTMSATAVSLSETSAASIPEGGEVGQGSFPPVVSSGAASPAKVRQSTISSATMAYSQPTYVAQLAHDVSQAISKTSQALSPSSLSQNYGPLVISFPSDLPSSSPPSVPSDTQPASPSETTPTVVVVPHEKDSRPAAVSKAEAGMSASAAVVNQFVANNVPSTTAASQPSTTQANGAGITIVPMGAESTSDQGSFIKTVTVTVTSFVHDRAY